MTTIEDYAPANGHRSDAPVDPSLVVLRQADGTGTVTIPTATLDDLRALSTLTRTADHELLRQAVEHLRSTKLVLPRPAKVDGASGGTAKAPKAKS
jgi:hypothetical protein